MAFDREEPLLRANLHRPLHRTTKESPAQRVDRRIASFILQQRTSIAAGSTRSSVFVLGLRAPCLRSRSPLQMEWPGMTFVESCKALASSRRHAVVGIGNPTAIRCALSESFDDHRTTFVSFCTVGHFSWASRLLLE